LKEDAKFVAVTRVLQSFATLSSEQRFSASYTLVVFSGVVVICTSVVSNSVLHKRGGKRVAGKRVAGAAAAAGSISDSAAAAILK